MKDTSRAGKGPGRYTDMGGSKHRKQEVTNTHESAKPILGSHMGYLGLFTHCIKPSIQFVSPNIY